MSRQLLPKVKGRVKGKDLGKDRAKDRSNELKTKVQGCDEEDNEDEERSGRWRRQSAGDGDHYDASQKRLTADERPSGYSMDRLGSDGTGFTDRHLAHPFRFPLTWPLQTPFSAPFYAAFPDFSASQLQC